MFRKMAAPIEQGKVVLSKFCQMARFQHRQAKLNMIQSRSMGFMDKLKFVQKKSEKEMQTDVVVPRPEKLPDELDTRVFRKRQGIEEVRSYTPIAEVTPCIKAISEQIFGPNENWQQIELNNRAHKFNLITRVMEELDHDVPNMCLHEMTTVADVVKYFQTEIKDSSKLEDLTKLNLPKNLHMNLEFIRFHKETDKIHGGVTAFPGRPTKVSSLKYRRKYTGYDGGDPVNYPESIVGWK